MEVKSAKNPKTIVSSYFGIVASVLFSIYFATVDNRSNSAIFALFALLTILGVFRYYHALKRRFVFDEIGVKMYDGERLKKQYEWKELNCIYYRNENLSKKEKKKLERVYLPPAPRIAIYVRNSRTKISLVDIILFEDSGWCDHFNAPKKDFLAKMAEWNVYLNSPD